jgi:release factor glutamine methyltransferase
MGEAVVVREAFAAVARRLREAGIETPELDARLLLCHAAGLTHEAFIARAGDRLTPEAQALLEAVVARRLAGEPVSRITGMREFYGREFLLGPDTLDPRPDTETLIEAVLALAAQNGWRNRPIDILDLGTGTGCILVTLLAELPQARGLATDIDPNALAVAAENARRHGVAARACFLAADWLDGIEGEFDLIVSNPPYLAASEMASLPAEVARDPRLALDGGADGLDAYRRIAASASDRLRDGGSLVLEIGASQAGAVARILSEAGFALFEPALLRDLAGRPRCLVGRRAQPERADGRRGAKFGLENGHVQVRFGTTTDILRPSAPARARPVATATRADFS